MIVHQQTVQKGQGGPSVRSAAFDIYMNEIKALEFTSVLEQLSTHAMSESAKELCMALKPAESIGEAERLLQETDMASVLLLKYGAPHFADLYDIVNSCRRAETGSVLSIRELLQIGTNLNIARGISEFLENRVEGTVFETYAAEIQPNKYFEEKISNAFIGEEEVADNASPALRDIRRKQMQAKSKIRSSLESILHSSQHQKHLQDSIVTIRNGRYVIPIKAEYRNEVGGLVHDVSASGATLFIEPVSVVQANNDLSVLSAEEHREIERILAEFSAEVASFSHQFIRNFEISRYMDFTFAKAHYAESMRCVRPLLNSDGHMVIKEGRHPLIDPSKVVPVSFSLGGEYNALIITGPNTGGKTVTLKTAGLLCLMAESGLFVPAATGTRIAFYDRVFADIGDDQSIAQNLSTFSAHMKNIVSITENATQDSLVLLDELGSGTDPAEGAALAVSVIEYLRGAGAKLICTTHYAELKLYAIQTEGVENASCEFDVETLSPTYRLVVGLPGKSNAFAIASKLGINPEIIENAGSRLSSETVKVEKLLADLETKRKSIEVDSERAAQLRREAEAETRKVEEELREKLSNAEKEIEKEKQKAAAVVERTKRDTTYMLRQLDELKKQKDKEDFAEKLSKIKKEVNTITDDLEKSTSTEVKREKKPLPRPLVKGDTVRIFSLDREATVEELPDSKGNVYVSAGAARIKVKLSDLELVVRSSKKKESSPTVSISRGGRTAKSELDIRGITALEAYSLVDDFLSDAYMAGLKTVSIIHGKGTGALRSAVHDLLRSHSLVKEYRLGVYGEGETGVTIVTLI